ncbi:hypothetical protein B0H12DRAFT_1080622 [Mycena haematopus]|nr:hypothetical protein B0H12DRAFT_1080622 [Mycena haematopus]
MTLDNRDQELKMARCEANLAQPEISRTAAQLQTQFESLSAHLSRTQKSNARLHTKHEDLKLTCRQLISLVEGLEAAGKPIDDAFSRLHRKYAKLKAEHEKLRTVLYKTLVEIGRRIEQELAVEWRDACDEGQDLDCVKVRETELRRKKAGEAPLWRSTHAGVHPHRNPTHWIVPWVGTY